MTHPPRPPMVNCPRGIGDFHPAKDTVFVAFGNSAHYYTLEEFLEYSDMVAALRKAMGDVKPKPKEKATYDKLVAFTRPHPDKPF